MCEPLGLYVHTHTSDVMSLMSPHAHTHTSTNATTHVHHGDTQDGRSLFTKHHVPSNKIVGLFSENSRPL